MRMFRLLLVVCIALPGIAWGQLRCAGFEYQQTQVLNQPGLMTAMQQLEQQILDKVSEAQWSRDQKGTLIIPVVFQNLYHFPSQKISDQQVQAQLKTLNDCFRMRNPDTAQTRPAFKAFAADCEIEFRLATADPNRRATTGIVRTYTPIAAWKMSDDMKFSDRMGADAWDAKSYLNIWVCSLDKFAGFTSVLGADPQLDGIVLDLGAIGAGQKTLVHEVGHWLGLRHLWGDEYCGDDGVNDTPKQASYTPGCPNTVRVTCGSNPIGDMYNNYMDFTNDACMTLFTEGQKRRMRSLFATGGLRASLPSSNGLKMPLFPAALSNESDPTWLEPKLYPNPAHSQIQLDLSYDRRWMGQSYQVYDMQGQVRIRSQFSALINRIELNGLLPGYYILEARRADGEVYKTRFVKQ